VAAISTKPRLWSRLAALLGGVLAATGARALDLPKDRGEALVHSYSGGGVTANGPAVLVRKSVSDQVSLVASYYLDSVSNASIDVVTTASAYRESRSEYAVGLDYVYRDSQVSVAASTSREPDYVANRVGIDVVQEVFGGMTSVSLGFTRGADDVGKHDAPEFSETATHWLYRVGLTQILTPRWIASVNAEALSDAGYLGSPYRVAQVFGAAVPERMPTTRSGRALNVRVLGDLGSRDSLRAEYRYYWDNWDLKAHTVQIGYRRHVGDNWLGDVGLRYYSQSAALFYSDNAQAETLYVTRNRQLSTFNNAAIGAKLAYTVSKVPGQYDFKINGAYEFVRFKYSDFTDIRTGNLYAYNANLLQLYASVTF
jgi:hypothetical protein